LRQSRTSKELRCSKNEREYLPNLAASLSNSFGQHPRRHVILSLSNVILSRSNVILSLSNVILSLSNVILSLSKDADGRHCSSSANR
jgi:hypothetical protein